MGEGVRALLTFADKGEGVIVINLLTLYIFERLIWQQQAKISET